MNTNKIIKWLGIEARRTIYFWYDSTDLPPPDEGMYLVIRENDGKRGSAHFDMYCPDQGGWMQISGSLVGQVVLWTEAPKTPEK